MRAELERVSQARRSLERVRLKLACPTAQALDSGAADLMVAAGCLRELESDLALRGSNGVARDSALAWEIGSLRSELRQVNALIENAGRFYEGWARLVSSSAGDGGAYTAEGKPGNVIPIETGRLVVHG